VINYTRHYVTDADIAAVVSVLKSDRLTQGPTVPLLEEAICRVIGCNHVVCVSSGTAGLALAYLASNCYCIVTSPISCMATPNAALSVGRQVEFIDTDPIHGMIPVISPSRGVLHVPVWLGGKSSIISEGQCVIDACQALGHPNLKDALKWVSAAVISFHPTKVIAAGEGGAVVTNDPDFAMRVREMRDYGREEVTRRQVRLGVNHRMDEMSAALALSQLSRLQENIAKRSALVDLYNDQLGNMMGRISPIPQPGTSTCYLYQVHCVGVDRDLFRKRLLERGIETQIHHPAIHLEPYYRQRFGYREGSFPNAEAFGASVVTLPLYSTMTREEVMQVVEAIKEAVKA